MKLPERCQKMLEKNVKKCHAIKLKLKIKRLIFNKLLAIQ